MGCTLKSIHSFEPNIYLGKKVLLELLPTTNNWKEPKAKKSLKKSLTLTPTFTVSIMCAITKTEFVKRLVSIIMKEQNNLSD